MDKNKLMTLAVVISLAGTASLYLYTASRDTLRMNISDIDHRLVGTRVETEGIISSVRKLQTSYLLSLLEEGCDTHLEAFVEGRVVEAMDDPVDMIPGARVRLRGILEDYEGKLSLRVSVPGELEILENAYSSFTHISVLLENPQWYSGMELKVMGKVVSTHTSSRALCFEIEQIEGGYHRLGCEFECSDTVSTINMMNGDPVTFEGTFLYDTGTGRWIIRGTKPPEIRSAP